MLSEGAHTAARVPKGDVMRDPDSFDLDVLLRSAATGQRDPATDERLFSDVWSRVQTSIGDGAAGSPDAAQRRRLSVIGDREVAARRRRRAARLASAALAVAVAGGGTAVAAEFISTRTGEELTGWEVEAGGSGEVLNLGGTDRGQVFDEVTADIPFAPGYEPQRAWALEFFPHETDVAISEEFLRSWVVGNAVCTWADAWVAADNVGDVAARMAATIVLAEAVSWKDIVESDIPDATILGSGEHLSYRWWVRPLADAAQTYFSRFGGVAPYEDHPLVFTADYHDADGNGFTLWLHSVDPRGLDDYFQPERPGDHDITETGTVSIDGSAAEFARGDADTGSSFANLRWERPDGRRVQILGDGSYAETSAVVAVAESLVDRPRPLGLQFGLAPAGWSLSGYEESRSIDLTRDDDSGQLLRLSVIPRGRRDARERVRQRGADGRPSRDGDGPGAGGPAGAQGRR